MLLAAGVNPKGVQHFMGWSVAEVMGEMAEAMERALSVPDECAPGPPWDTAWELGGTRW